jgi:hypothetical protein
MFSLLHISRIAPKAALLLLSADVLQAQACLGLGTPSASSRMLSTTASGTDIGRTVSARYALTSERLFGGVHLGAAGGKFARMNSPVVGGDIGAVVPLGGSGATQLCPVFQSSFQRGPQSLPSVRNQLSTSIGLSLGRAYSLTGTMKFIPFVQGGALYVRQRYGFNSLGLDPTGRPFTGTWGHHNTLFGEMAAGFGLTLKERLTLTPRYSLPVGAVSRPGRYQQTYSLGVTFGIPR